MAWALLVDLIAKVVEDLKDRIKRSCPRFFYVCRPYKWARQIFCNTGCMSHNNPEIRTPGTSFIATLLLT